LKTANFMAISLKEYLQLKEVKKMLIMILLPILIILEVAKKS
jgi:hypothetical protein